MDTSKIKQGQIFIEYGRRWRWDHDTNGLMEESAYREKHKEERQNAGGQGRYYVYGSSVYFSGTDYFVWDQDHEDGCGLGGYYTESRFDQKYRLTPSAESDKMIMLATGRMVEEEERETPVSEIETPVKRGRGRPRKEVTEARRVEESTKDALMELFLMGAREKITDAIEKSTADAVNDIVGYVDAVREEILLFEGRKLTLMTPNGEKVVTGSRHEKFEQLLQTVSVGLAAMIVGPAGSGKTFASEQVAEALDLPFYAISVGSQTSKSDLIGFITAHGDYIRTQFREAYENGGVFLMDEIDAGNANVLVLLNSALAGSSAAFPDGMVKKHENFRFIATANTFGTGANRQYVGRNQIDAATLDRFVTIIWPVDTKLEAATVTQYTNGAKWHKVILDVRKLVEDNSWRLVVSPRATIKGSALLDAGVDVSEVINMVLLGQADASQQTLIRTAAERAWR